jgi:YebC/PmpR family DNA-binding regulatory protein
MFSKLSRAIIVAAKSGAPDPELNYRLRLAIEKAKEFNMPKDNIERAVKKGAGEGDAEVLEEISVEAHGPGGSLLILEGITDNKNRTLGEVKSILGKYQGKMVAEGAAKWMFERKGVVRIELGDKEHSKENVEMKIIEAGAEDMIQKDSVLEVYTASDRLDHTKQALISQGLSIKESALEWIPKEEVKLSPCDAELCEKLFEALDDNDAIQEIYSNGSP